jgi:hypothetical protein
LVAMPVMKGASCAARSPGPAPAVRSPDPGSRAAPAGRPVPRAPRNPLQDVVLGFLQRVAHQIGMGGELFVQPAASAPVPHEWELFARPLEPPRLGGIVVDRALAGLSEVVASRSASPRHRSRGSRGRIHGRAISHHCSPCSVLKSHHQALCVGRLSSRLGTAWARTLWSEPCMSGRPVTSAHRPQLHLRRMWCLPAVDLSRRLAGPVLTDRPAQRVPGERPEGRTTWPHTLVSPSHSYTLAGAYRPARRGRTTPGMLCLQAS